MEIPKLSFCITCKNRFYQISKTLPKNLKDNERFKGMVEFILVDFGSEDGLKDWILENFTNELAEGYLKYYYTEELPYWHACIAKNTAHLLANHDILVNLDCDNFTGFNGGYFIIEQFMKYGKDIFIHQSRKNSWNGSYGRISVMRDYFNKIGGYNENFEPMAFQDDDLMYRLSALRLKYVHISNNEYNDAIKNTKQESIRYSNSDLNWHEMLWKNMFISRKNILEGNLVANNGKWGIRKNIYNHFGKRVIL